MIIIFFPEDLIISAGTYEDHAVCARKHDYTCDGRG